MPNLYDDELQKIDMELNKLEGSATPEDNSDKEIEPEVVTEETSEKTPIDDNKDLTEEKAELTEEVPEVGQTSEEEETEPENVKAPELFVTEDLINSVDEDLRRYLEKHKGQPIQEVFKSYANAQKLIGKKSIPQNLETPKTEPQENFRGIEELSKKEPVLDEVDTSRLSKEALTERDSLIIEALKNKDPEYRVPPNLDERSEEYRQWAADYQYNDPAGWKRFDRDKDRIEREITEVVEKTEYVKKNYATVNLGQINKSVEAINSYLKKLDVSDKFMLSPLNGLEVKDDRLSSILLNDRGFNSEVVSSFYNVPVVDPDRVAAKFIQTHLPDIINLQRAEIAKAAYKKAKTPPDEPSLSQGSKGQSKVQDFTPKNLTTQEEIDAALDELEKRISKGA